jgi:hypothetical protein
MPELTDTGRTLVAGDKGLLAMDESNATCNKRFARLRIPQNEDARRAHADFPTGSRDWNGLICRTPWRSRIGIDCAWGSTTIASARRNGTQRGDGFGVCMTVAGAPRLPALQLKGWTAAETTTFVTARQTFGTGDVTQQTATGGAKVITTTKNADPANAGARDQVRLKIFPPASTSSPATPDP